MRKYIAKLLILVSLLIGLVSLPAPAFASIFQPCDQNGALNSSQNAVCSDASGGKALFGPGSTWNKILNAITYVCGAVAVIIIILAGLRYVLSNGVAAEIKTAKDAILYAAIGLVITAMANAIVNFILINI